MRQKADSSFVVPVNREKRLLDSGQADIRNPLRYLLITECCFAAYQEWLAPLLIQASPNPLLIALRN